MITWLQIFGLRVRLITNGALRRLGLSEEHFLIPVAVLIGICTAFAAVAFHELIYRLRDLFYVWRGPENLYGRDIWLLAVIPAAGGLVVGLHTHFSRRREGHGVIDVIESVIRSTGFVHPRVALEKILTSGVTLGTGGSAGAEGPIVQIGAAISSGIGSIFRVSRQQMPIVIGCGAAAGISAIFNAPIGGVFFTLEVILFDFSLRTFTPVVVAAVIANVTTHGIFQFLGEGEYQAILAIPSWAQMGHKFIDWGQILNFAALGIVCGAIGVSFTRLMLLAEARFAKLQSLGYWRPALGGLILGVSGIIYVLIFGRILLGQLKPFDSNLYPMPAFFGDGYGIIRQFLDSAYYTTHTGWELLLLLGFLLLAKILGTCVTLASGGSGGIIAPSLFMGATAGALCGIVLRSTGFFPTLQPEIYALVGMGAVLAAVVHAPLASILIVFELTRDYSVMVPAMLACVVSASVARVMFRDSIYTHALRARGVQVGGVSDMNLHCLMRVEQVAI